MKFIHIADVHFDMPLISLKGNRDYIKKRRIEQKQAFRDVILLAKKEKLDCIFISGDLFEQKFVEKGTIEYIISNFQLIPNVNIFISPGNHDPYIKDSPYETYEWPENVTIFKSDYGMISLDDCDIYGVGFENYEEDFDIVKNIEIEDENKVNILVTHGTLNGATHKYHDIKERDLNKFDYVALGHIHDKKIDKSKIIYPGSLISCGFDEPGEHGVVLGELTKEKVKIEFLKMDDIEFEIKIIDISKCLSPNEVLDKLNLKDNIYKVVLTGVRNIDINTLKEMILVSGKYVCEVEDRTRMDYNFESIASQKTLKGVFTRKMLEELKKNPEDEEKIMKVIEYVYNNM